MMTANAPATDLRTPYNPNANSSGRVTALLLVLESLLATIPFFILGAVFEFPDILRQGADRALPLFAQSQQVIVPTYYAFMLSSVLLIPLSLLLRRVLTGKGKGAASDLLNIATAFGAAAGLSQILGFIRWPFMVPYLAQTHLDPASSAATRDAVAVVYEGFNRYAGVAVGEHLGWLFLGLWLVTVSGAIYKRLSRWLGVTGLLLGAGFLVSILEQFGGDLAPVFATASLVANTAWSLWLVLAAVVVWQDTALAKGR